jgi:TPR repeat protein
MSIFLSYRRADSQEVVGRIYDRLVQRFSKEQIFRDLDSLEIGRPFPVALDEAIKKAKVALVLIGPSWVAIKDSDEKRRLDDPADFVRREVEIALSSGIPVVPVLVSNAKMPTEPELPDSLRPLVVRHGISVRPDPDFHKDINSLINRLLQIADLHTNVSLSPQTTKLDMAPAEGAAGQPDKDDVGLELQEELEECERLLRVSQSKVNAFIQTYAPIRLSSWRVSALRGSPQGQFLLGCCFDKGSVLAEDPTEAARWYRKAAEQGVAIAQYTLGIAFEIGRGVGKDKNEAFRWYRKAAEQELPAAQYSLGWAYIRGDLGAVDDLQGVYWHRKAANQGHRHAQLSLASAHETGNGVKKDNDEAARWRTAAQTEIKELAEQGHAEIQVELGIAYQSGEYGLKKDIVEAVRWYRMAAEQGDAWAQQRLGDLYSSGNESLAANPAEALRWYRSAAEQGKADCQFEVGRCYELGKGVERDCTEAVRWYRMAAKQGHHFAQGTLGDILREGRQGVAENPAEAVHWYRLAVEMRWRWNLAPFWLGYMYSKGLGVKQDSDESVRWYRLAADWGILDAQNHLGNVFMRGEGVKQDRGEGLFWLLKAAENDERARRSLDQYSGASQAIRKVLDSLASEKAAPLVNSIVTALEQLNREKEAAIAEQDFEKAASIRDQADRLKKQKAYVAIEITPERLRHLLALVEA